MALGAKHELDTFQAIQYSSAIQTRCLANSSSPHGFTRLVKAN
jgi:hypothetical protein